MKKVRLGIVGLGNMGATHARSILAGNIARAELVAVCDPDQGCLKPFPDQKHFKSADAMIASG
jgi:predicted dehydrogenase